MKQKIIDLMYKKIFNFMKNRSLLNWIDDEKFLKINYKLKTGRNLNLEKPILFNEKMQWLKLYNRKPIYTKMVDKYEAKKYVAEKIGDEYIIKNLGVWDSFKDINWNNLPSKFVLKCTHDSGGVFICENKNLVNKKEIKKRINKALKSNFYNLGREWPYKNVVPKIIAEPFLEENDDDLKDYKIHCFNGKAKILLICSNRKKDVEYTYYDCDFNLLDLTEGGHKFNPNLKRPKNLKKMIEIAELFSENIPFLRVDFYEINGKLYFGEFTFFTSSGFEFFEPEQWNETMGNWIDIKDI